MLRIFSLRPGFNPRTWVPKVSTLPLDHRSRCLESSSDNNQDSHIRLTEKVFIFFPPLSFPPSFYCPAPHLNSSSTSAYSSFFLSFYFRFAKKRGKIMQSITILILKHKGYVGTKNTSKSTNQWAETLLCFKTQR